MKSQAFLLVLALLLVFLVGPLFGPVGKYLNKTRDARKAAALEIVLFLVTAAIVFGVVYVWMMRNGRTFADLGWGQPTTRLATVLGILLGLFWGVLGAFGYLQFVPTANILEISGFRVFMAVAGASVAIIEDLMTRGLLMNELQRWGSSTWMQVLASSLLFALYHTIWGFNPVAFVFTLVYGLLLAGLFVLGHRSLTPVILGHALALLIGEPFLTMSQLEAIKLQR